MCLVTEQLEPKVLNKDLEVYKVVHVTKFGRFQPMDSLRRNKITYEIDYLYTTEMVANDHAESYADDIVRKAYGKEDWMDAPVHVHEGFHASLTKGRVMSWGIGSKDTYGSFRIAKCVIPKGSSYYKDKTGLIVSNQIILKEILKENPEIG